jgi:predicted acyltransferase
MLAAACAGKLFGLGLVIQGGVATGKFPSYNLAVLRYMGVLQRIAMCFLITAIVAMVAVQTVRCYPSLHVGCVGTVLQQQRLPLVKSASFSSCTRFLLILLCL